MPAIALKDTPKEAQERRRKAEHNLAYQLQRWNDGRIAGKMTFFTPKEKFRDLLRPLNENEFNALEARLLAEGCLSPFIMWYDKSSGACYLADGYNRQRICEKHGLPFKIEMLDLPSEGHVMDWIIQHQLGRRNLTAEERAYLIGKQYNERKASHGGDRASGQIDHLKEEKPKTAAKMAKELNISEKTIRRDAQFAAALDKLAEVDPKAKDRVLAGEARLTKAQIETLANAPESQVKRAAEMVTTNRDSTMALVSSSKTDLHATPEKLYKVLDAEFGFALDVCANADNAKCARFFTKEDNGLAQSWAADGPAWCNPPYGKEIGEWVEKAFWTAALGINTVVMLLPGRTHTTWYYNWGRFAHGRFIFGQLHFNEAEHGAPFNSVVLVFTPEMTKPGYKPNLLHWDWEKKADKKARVLSLEDYQALKRENRILRVTDAAFMQEGDQWVRVRIPAQELRAWPNV